MLLSGIYRCLCCSVFVCLSVTLWGQSPPRDAASVSGEVAWDAAAGVSTLSVELVASGCVVSRVSPGADCSFELAAVPPGEYELRVAGRDESVVERQFVSVHGHVEGVLFRLGGGGVERPVNGTVSVCSLSHPAPAAARKELVRASKAVQRGVTLEAIRHLRKALAIFPDYMEAHNDLGVHLLRQGGYEQAADEFREAARLDPQAALPNTNLALASVLLKRCADAQTFSQRAIAVDPSYAPARRALSMAVSGACREPRATAR